MFACPFAQHISLKPTAARAACGAHGSHREEASSSGRFLPAACPPVPLPQPPTLSIKLDIAFSRITALSVTLISSCNTV